MIEDIILELPQHTWRMLEIRTSQDVDAYLTKLPWEISGHRLDWSRIKSKHQVILYSDDIYESKDIYQLKNFNCFNGTHCIFFYSAWKASILIETSVAIMNFNIFSIFDRAVYFFAANSGEDGLIITNKFMELDPRRHIAGTLD